MGLEMIVMEYHYAFLRNVTKAKRNFDSSFNGFGEWNYILLSQVVFLSSIMGACLLPSNHLSTNPAKLSTAFKQFAVGCYRWIVSVCLTILWGCRLKRLNSERYLNQKNEILKWFENSSVINWSEDRSSWDTSMKNLWKILSSWICHGSFVIMENVAENVISPEES